MASPYTDGRLLEILRDLAAELGQSPTWSGLLARRDLPSPITYVNRFGSWNAALEAAGLKLNRARQVQLHAWFFLRSESLLQFHSLERLGRRR